MKITYLHKYDLSKPCVAKIWFGARYLIIKSPDIKASVRTLIDTFKEAPGPTEGVVAFATRKVRASILEEEATSKKCVVEIMLSSSKGEELLAKEQALLNLKDKQCMNIGKTPVRPKWIYELMSPTLPDGLDLFSIKGRHRSAPAVVKLWVGKKFFIWKCKDIQVFPAKFSDSMRKNIDRYEKENSDPLWPLVTYMHENSFERGMIEVVYKGDCTKKGVKKLLSVEKTLLHKFYKKPECLNRSVKPYMPQWIKELLNPPIK